jgi:hypothetical protein
LIEQLYADMDIFGQITALRTLAQPHITHQTIPAQILRLRALKDVLLTATNDGNVVHSLVVRLEAIYAISEWQNAHAPMMPRPRNDHTSGYAWAGLDILLGCLRGMFTDLSKGAILRPDSDLRSNYLPVPNDFMDHTKTQLRSALLVALSSIRAGNGETPPEIIEELLHFAENNDNSHAAAAPTADSETSAAQQTGGSESSVCYDDGHYCATLLFCLSKVSSSSSVGLLKRVVEVSKYYLHRESIITAAQLYEEEGNAGAGINRARGFYMAGEESWQKKTESKSGVGRGFVTAMALQCICNAEIQLDTSPQTERLSQYEPFNFRQYITAPAPAPTSAGTGTGTNEAKQRVSPEQEMPIVPSVSGLVRASALDCCLRLAFAKHIARLLLTNTSEGPTSPTARRSNDLPSSRPRSANEQSTKKGPSPADAINLVLSVIVHDPARQVRRSAALSLLYVLQVRCCCLSVPALVSPLLGSPELPPLQDPESLRATANLQLERPLWSGRPESGPAPQTNLLRRAPPGHHQVDRQQRQVLPQEALGLHRLQPHRCL